MKIVVKEMLCDSVVSLSDVEAFATNVGADNCNWHTREKFESRETFFLYSSLGFPGRQDGELWALIDDGRAEGAVWMPVEIKIYK